MTCNVRIVDCGIVFISDEEQAIQLQTLHGIARERSDMCNWEQNFRPVLLKLIELLEKNDAQLQVLSLRVLREMLKSKPELLKDYTEMTVMKVLNTYCCEVAEVCVCVCVFTHSCMCVYVCVYSVCSVHCSVNFRTVRGPPNSQIPSLYADDFNAIFHPPNLLISPTILIP